MHAAVVWGLNWLQSPNRSLGNVSSIWTEHASQELIQPVLGIAIESPPECHRNVDHCWKEADVYQLVDTDFRMNIAGDPSVVARTL